MNPAESDDIPKGTNAQEEKELRRVFDHLALYRDKKKVSNVISTKKERKAQLEVSVKSLSACPVIDASGNRMTEEDIATELQNLQSDIDKKTVELNALMSQPNKAIRTADLSDALKALGKNVTKKEVEGMIWEADENLDNAVDWEELKAMFNRNLMDKTELEPVNLFNVIQFMTYDKRLCGTITADDTMAILFARYGRLQLESRMKMLFGTSEELSFVDFLERVSCKKRK